MILSKNETLWNGLSYYIVGEDYRKAVRISKG
jgi:hypothetical protein